MKSNFTPGPWFQFNAVRIVDGPGCAIAYCAAEGTFPSSASARENVANARAIAALPAAFALLAQCADYLEDVADRHPAADPSRAVAGRSELGHALEIRTFLVAHGVA